MEVTSVLGLLWIAYLIIFYVLFLVAVADLAKRYGRNATGYVVLAVFFSPLTSFVLLLCRGESGYAKVFKEYQKSEDIMKEKERAKWMQSVMNQQK